VSGCEPLTFEDILTYELIANDIFPRRIT